MAYESITIGTEQEIKEVYLFLVNEDGSPAELDQDSKAIASIWEGEEKLADVTADTRITIPGFGTCFQLELATTPAGNHEADRWRKRKEAIKLFVREFVPMQKQTKNPADADLTVAGKHYIAGEFSTEVQGEGLETYKIKGKPGDRRKFYFFRNEYHSVIRCANQMTIGIGRDDLTGEFLQKALWDRRKWDMPWMKDLSEELADPLGAVNPTAEQKFMYSYVGSIFDWSVKLYVRQHPNHTHFTDFDRNHAEEKNMWGVLPRSPVYKLVDYLKINEKSVFNFLKSRKFNDGNSPEKMAENQIYTELSEKFWNLYDSGDGFTADSLLRAGVISNTGNQYLFEFRTVRTKIENIYEDSSQYIYRG